MKKIAIISDIHSNIAALKAVFTQIEKLNIDTVLCSGDIVGYHTFPNEVVEFLIEKDVISIGGNHDLDIINKKFNPDKTPDIFEFTYNLLTTENLKWLTSLPKTKLINIEDKSFFICHGSPKSEEEYLFEDDKNSENYAKESEYDILISGHTHLPWIKEYNSTLFINSGSVGKPKNGSPKASFATVTIDNNVVSSELMFVDYPVEECAKPAEELGFKKYADALRVGRA